MSKYPLLDSISSPGDLKAMSCDELRKLSTEIRQYLLFYLSQTGGHLASNLGVVELSIALHYVLDSPKDKIIWDVGHQAYVHKILTDRKDLFHSLRQFGGISGFPKRIESDHDIFETGHSSTSISAALGIARARDLLGEDYKVTAIIGDGSIAGGMAFEALNDAGHSATDLTVILNDNQMSISPNVGALSRHLTHVRSHPAYSLFKKGMGSVLGRIPVLGRLTVKAFDKLKKTLKYFLVPGIIFEEMGFKYLGPIDGHDVQNLISILRQAAFIKGPVMIHIVTTKGKGYEVAETSPDVFHSVPPFTLKTGEFRPTSKTMYSQAVGEHLVEMAKRDKRIVAVTAAMAEGTGLSVFRENFPDRFFDVGIAEQHALTMSAGIASQGGKPYVAIYSTFLQRAYDQILHDICIQKLPVVILIDRAGLVGEDGETHHGVFDIAFLRHIPNIRIWAPKDVCELKSMLDASLDADSPIAIRYEKGPSDLPYSNNAAEDNLFSHSWQLIRKGTDALVLSFGRMLSVCVKASDLLEKEGVSLQIVNARTIKPLDENMLIHSAEQFSTWVTIEDSAVHGGFGSFVNEFAVAGRMNVRIANLGIPDTFVSHGSTDTLLGMYSLDPVGLAQKISSFLKEPKVNSHVRG